MAASKVSGKSYVGGISGYSYGKGKLENVRNAGEVTGEQIVGGITGIIFNGGNITNSYNEGEIKGDTQIVGGIAGWMYTNTNTAANLITNTYNVGSVISGAGVGGIVGYISGTGNTVANGYNLGTVTGIDEFGSIVGGLADKSSLAVQNAYFLTADGYQKYDDNTVYTTLEVFNKAFAEGLGEDDKNAWQTGQKQTAPYLQSFLETISGDVGNVESTAGSDCKAALLERLQTLGITVDPDKILGLENLAAGEYDLSELLYSTQDGYDLQLTGKLVLKAEPQPQPGPSTDSKYTAALTSIQKKAPNNWEQNVPDEKRLRIEENRTISLEKNTVKIEAVLWDEVNLQEEEPLNE